jgi:hypothetical protein
VGSFNRKGLRVFRGEQLLLTEIESEWIRMYFIQGLDHYNAHYTHWGAWMNQLLGYWAKLEQRTHWVVYDFLMLAVEGRVKYSSEHDTGKHKKKRAKAAEAFEDLLTRGSENNKAKVEESAAISEMFDGLAEMLSERSDKRVKWQARETDSLWSSMPPGARPIAVPVSFADCSYTPMNSSDLTAPLPTPVASPLSADLSGVVSGLGRWRDILLGRPHSSSDFELPGSLTTTKRIDVKGSRDTHCCLEMQTPFSDWLVSSTKTIETRRYPLPADLVGKKVYILETPAGADAVSALGSREAYSSAELLAGRARIIGWAVFGSMKEYKDRKAFKKDRALHKVSSKSGYGWSESTSLLYGWEVESCGGLGADEDMASISISRRFRSIFDIKIENGKEEKPTVQASLKRKSGSLREETGEKKKRY